MVWSTRQGAVRDRWSNNITGERGVRHQVLSTDCLLVQSVSIFSSFSREYDMA